jgi:hypothetical protein
MLNGIIGFICKDRKVIDLKITNSFPIIALQPKTMLVVENGARIDVSGYQHFSIPPDLCIHLTKHVRGNQQPEHIFFEGPHLKRLIQRSISTPFRLFTFVSAPISSNPLLKGDWHETVFMLPTIDDNFDPDRTRIFIDYFIHEGESMRGIATAKSIGQGMRCGKHCLCGPFAFEDYQRTLKSSSDIFFTLRYGYTEMQPAQDCYIYIPYRIRKRPEHLLKSKRQKCKIQ